MNELHKPRAMVHVRLIRDEHGLYAAQCLEYDICAQGDDPVKALESWRKAAMGQIAQDKQRGRDPLAAFPCAPIPLWCDIKRDEIVGIYLEGIRLPTIREMSGLVHDFTNGKSMKEYMEELSNE